MATEMSDVRLSIDAEPGDKNDEDTDNVKDNPYVENANLGGVRLQVADREFVPKPFKKIKYVIMVSYFCYIFLIFPGAIANQYAWEAKKYKELGAKSEAKAMVRSAVCWIYVGFAIGGLLLLTGIIVAVALHV